LKYGTNELDTCTTDGDCDPFLAPSPSPTASESDPFKNVNFREGKIDPEAKVLRAGYNWKDLDRIAAQSSNKDSPVVVEVFQDLKCGMCKRAFNDSIKQLLANEVKQNKVKIVFREYPLIKRKEEVGLAIAAKCAGRQGRYLAFLDQVYTNIKEIKVDNLLPYVTAANLDEQQFHDCFNNRLTANEVHADVALGKKHEIKGTPAFLINGKLAMGAKPYAKMQELISAGN
jgi:protein-disulfide isomerase